MTQQDFKKMMYQIWDVVNKYDVEGCVWDDDGQMIITLDCDTELLKEFHGSKDPDWDYNY